MRRMNSEFKTANMSEEGQKLSNRDYFGYVETYWRPNKL